MIRKSLEEFQKYCDTLRPKEYILNMENQRKSDMLSVQAVLRFDTVVARPFTRRVMFSGGSGFICFNDVECIEITEDYDTGAFFFSIICHNRNKRYPQEFIMLAD